MTEGSFYIPVSLPPERCFPHLEEMDTSCRERLKIIEKAIIQQTGVTKTRKVAVQMA